MGECVNAFCVEAGVVLLVVELGVAKVRMWQVSLLPSFQFEHMQMVTYYPGKSPR